MNNFKTIFLTIYIFISALNSRTVYDAYNDRKVVLTDREMEIIRRIQSGAFAHPEFEANAVSYLLMLIY